MYQLKSSFRPASSHKNSYIGKADITVGNAVKLNDVSVFEKDGIIKIHFQSYGEKQYGFVVPHSKDVYAALCNIVEKAVHSKNHEAFENGEVNPTFTVTGAKVSDSFVDGRFSVEIPGFCKLNGISTRELNAENKECVSVLFPAVRDANGQIKMVNRNGKASPLCVFEGINISYVDKEDKVKTKNYQNILSYLVRSKRAALTLDDYKQEIVVNLLNHPDRFIRELVEGANGDLEQLSEHRYWGVRAALVEQGYNLEHFVRDEDSLVRSAVAKQGCYLDVLVEDYDEDVRAEVARQGYALERLSNDRSPVVRQAVVEQGYNLDKFLYDISSDVRKAVARQGYRLDILLDDEDENVVIAAEIAATSKEAVYEKYGFGDEYRELYGSDEKELEGPLPNEEKEQSVKPSLDSVISASAPEKRYDLIPSGSAERDNQRCL